MREPRAYHPCNIDASDDVLLRAMNDRLAGRRPRPELKLIVGGRGSAAKS